MPDNNKSEYRLLTPGPLNTSPATKEAMLRDWGSREHGFTMLTKSVRERLLNLAGGDGTHTAVPIQGSGTFAVEAMIGTLLPPHGKLLVLINGAYGKRMFAITERIARNVSAIESPENSPVDPEKLDRALAADPEITHVAVIHCETTSGVLNPVGAIAEVVAHHRRRLLIDAMSSFGALPLDASRISFDAFAASANKCLEGVPGVSFVVVRNDTLQQSEGNAHSLSLDLYQQWKGFDQNGQWRFTPPTHVLAALAAALEQHAAEGGVEERGARYRNNCKILIEGMRALGFRTFLEDRNQSPIIATFFMPADPAFTFEKFYNQLYKKGFIIYPGKVTAAQTFRIGCIGQIDAVDMRATLEAVEETLREMSVVSATP